MPLTSHEGGYSPARSRPQVTVVIPTHNRRALVGEAIESVIAQRYSDWELIVVDDGSDDDTRSVVEGRDSRIRYVCQEHAGPCRARNLGLAQARGALVSFLDSDDLMRPEQLGVLTELVDRSRGTCVAYGWSYWLDPRGRAVELCAPTMEEDVLNRLALGDAILMGTALVRTECARRIGGFAPTLAFVEHWDFFLRLAAAGCRFACARTPIALLRYHGGNRGFDYPALLSDYERVVAALPVSAEARRQARRQMWLHFFRGYDSQRDAPNIGLYLGALLREGHPGDLVCDELVGRLVRLALEAPDAVAWLERAFSAAAGSRTLSQIQRTACGELHARLAFRGARAGSSVLRALRFDPTLAGDLGLMRRTLPAALPAVHIRRAVVGRLGLLERAARTTSIFVSPHLDDAVLACGGTMAHLARRVAPIVMVTAFTEPPPPDMKISPLAAALRYAWAGDYRQRLDEDRRVAGMLGARVVWLGLLDAVYRDPSLDDAALVDPAFDVRQDPTLRELTARLVRVIVEHRDALVFVPLGVGNHRDHLLCHAAAAAAERAAAPGTRFYYYEDFPYSTIAPADRRALSLGLSHPELIDISRTLWERVHLVGLYTSQLVSAFDEPDDRHALIRSYAVSVGRGGRPAERFWPGRHLPLPEFGGKAPA